MKLIRVVLCGLALSALAACSKDPAPVVVTPPEPVVVTPPAPVVTPPAPPVVIVPDCIKPVPKVKAAVVKKVVKKAAVKKHHVKKHYRHHHAKKVVPVQPCNCPKAALVAPTPQPGAPLIERLPGNPVVVAPKSSPAVVVVPRAVAPEPQPPVPPVVVVPENPAKRHCERKGGWWNIAVPYCEYQMP